MKTVTLTDEAYSEICATLDGALNGKAFTIDFLVHRFGMDSAKVREEIDAASRLEKAEIEFREGIETSG